jgi:uncharacterized repeat protein (TIGR03803 family)
MLFVVCSAGRLLAQTNEVVRYSFAAPQRGASPFAGVIRDAAGNIFGTTYWGGPANAGVVFKVSPAGVGTVLYSFTSGADGGNPRGDLVQDSSGNIYGTTFYGGGSNAGVIFKLDSTGNETVLHSFTAGSDGGYPRGHIVRDPAGNLYGSTTGGGPAGAGVAFGLASSGLFRVLSTFGGNHGGSPNGGFIRDSAGSLYGTLSSGGKANAGSVIKLDKTGKQTVLYTFAGAPDGASPMAGLIRDSAGNLYGTTYLGGTSNAGTVFKVDTSGHETVLYNFTGGADGGNPLSGVVQDSSGNLYGTTQFGGTPGLNFALGFGVVFKLDTSGHETVLYSFTGGADGGNPLAGLTQDASGNLYGATEYGGGSNAGVVFKLDTAGHETVLYRFPGSGDGFIPESGLIRDSSGNLYGTTFGGGEAGWGAIYKVDPGGRETLVYSFPGGAGGANPQAGLIRDSAGNLYGTTAYGGVATTAFPDGPGVIFKVDTSGNETVVYTFTGGADGAYPAGLARDDAGNLYGTASAGGVAGFGVVFMVDATGHQSVLHSFTGGNDGKNPLGGVIRDSAGNIFGTTYTGGAANAGIVFKIDPGGHETVLYNFTEGSDGGYPLAGVIQDSAGNLYGTTVSGGAGRSGAVFKLEPSGQETALYSFTGFADGGYPESKLIQDSAGNVYGTTSGGGGNNRGVVFKVDSSGNETVLYSFSGGADGGLPLGLVRDPAGNIFGTTSAGGNGNVGVVFELKPN